MKPLDVEPRRIQSNRPTGDYAPAILWSVAEADAFVISLCMPYLVSKWCPTSRPPGLLSVEEKRSQRLVTHKSTGSINSTRTATVAGRCSALFSGALGPTTGESVDWVEMMQSFPTEGRPQHVMVSTKMGTTSSAEAVLRARGSSDSREEGEEANGGILVITEVRREIVYDPNYRVFGASS